MLNSAFQAARLRALDASLKAMEAEDDTGTLSKLKASLQHELEAKSDDDGSHYGSDFEEDFEEDAIARCVGKMRVCHVVLNGKH
ncbi:hypothetical protein DYB32_006986 [Aphanomyces invadans]|uniref:Uncharacterized protein n=1 Tax=Aphanomyces invadans TaxID=157072 RepID=A0A418AX94_9STRA|nr:hypothetical protein DYB32_006986 [Aphanomyces invadans]